MCGVADGVIPIFWFRYASTMVRDQPCGTARRYIDNIWSVKLFLAVRAGDCQMDANPGVRRIATAAGPDLWPVSQKPRFWRPGLKNPLW